MTQFLQVPVHLFSQTEASCYLHMKIILTVLDKLITECLIGASSNSVPCFTSKRLSFGSALYLYPPSLFFCVFSNAICLWSALYFQLQHFLHFLSDIDFHSKVAEAIFSCLEGRQCFMIIQF